MCYKWFCGKTSVSLNIVIILVLIKNVIQLEDIRSIDNRACDAAACEEETIKVMVKNDTCQTKGTLKVTKNVS